MIKWVKTLLTHPAFYRILGLVCLTLFILYLGDLLAFGSYQPLKALWVRWLLVISLWLMVLMPWLVKKGLAGVKSRGLINALQSSLSGIDPKDLENPSIAAMKEGFEAGIQALKSRTHRKAFYQLPWYVLIGPPGCGKTTALLHSGLEFNLRDTLGSESFSGAHGTRNCDWLLTDQAVLIDTAGRYFSQDSDANNDMREWSTFIKLLKRYRPRPINGVMIAVGVDNILGVSDEERAKHAQAIRRRLSELESQLGAQLPVYFLLTKVDLIDGFTEFFDTLTTAERQQVWGVSLSETEAGAQGDPSAGFSAQCDELFARIFNQRLVRMQDEPDEHRRLKIFNFPQQLAAHKAGFVQFVRQVFGPRVANATQSTPWLRGIYLTSGTQEGTPLDQLVSSLESRLNIMPKPLEASPGLAQFPGMEGFTDPQDVATPKKGKSYFLQNLLKNVICESHLINDNPKLMQGVRRIRYSGYAAVLVVSIGLVGIWSYHYWQNQSFQAELSKRLTLIASQTQGVPQEKSMEPLNLIDRIVLLNAAENALAFARSGGQNFALGWVLDQAATAVEHLEELYEDLLLKLLGPFLVNDLEVILSRKDGSIEQLYPALKAYVSLARDEPQVESFVWAHIREGHFEASMRDQLHSNDPMALDALKRHLKALVDRGQSIGYQASLSVDLVEQARGGIEREPTDVRLYRLIKSYAQQQPDVKAIEDFTLRNAIGLNGEYVFERRSQKPLKEGIPGLFTADGYRLFLKMLPARVEALLKEQQWLLEAPLSSGTSLHESFNQQPQIADTKQIDKALIAQHQERVKTLYLEEYRHYYHQLIQDVEIASFSSVADANWKLSHLANPKTSPFIALMCALSEQTALHLIDKDYSKFSSAIKKGAEFIDPIIDTEQFRNGAARPTNLVQFKFSAFHELADPEVCGTKKREEGLSPHLLNLVSQFEDVQKFFGSASLEEESGLPLPEELSKRGRELARLLRIESNRSKEFVPHVFGSLSSGILSLVNKGARERVNRMWQEEAFLFCKQNIEDRFPVNMHSQSEISREAFNRFFSAQGYMHEFFKGNLKRFVKPGADFYSNRAGASSNLGLSKQGLEMFRKADVIRNSMFGASSNELQLDFRITPLYIDKRLNIATLEIAGKKLTFEHGVSPSVNVLWPGSEQTQSVRLQVFSTDEEPYSETFTGVWALHKFLKSSKVTAIDSRSIKVRHRINGYEVVYKITEADANRPLQMVELKGFSCQTQL